MATIKSYTDLPQSKKLSEILSLETADMHYTKDYDGSWFVGLDAYSSIKLPKYATNNVEDYLLPCWSLAALLDVLPSYLFEFERGIDLSIYPNLNSNGWHCSYMPNNLEDMEKDKFKLITNKDSLVDACYEMILKLKELKLL